MILKRVNLVLNKMRSNGLERSHFSSQRNPWISGFDVVLLKVELEMIFFAVSDLKSAQKLWF